MLARQSTSHLHQMLTSLTRALLPQLLSLAPGGWLNNSCVITLQGHYLTNIQRTNMALTHLNQVYIDEPRVTNTATKSISFLVAVAALKEQSLILAKGG